MERSNGDERSPRQVQGLNYLPDSHDLAGDAVTSVDQQEQQGRLEHQEAAGNGQPRLNLRGRCASGMPFLWYEYEETEEEDALPADGAHDASRQRDPPPVIDFSQDSDSDAKETQPLQQGVGQQALEPRRARGRKPRRQPGQEAVNIDAVAKELKRQLKRELMHELKRELEAQERPRKKARTGDWPGFLELAGAAVVGATVGGVTVAAASYVAHNPQTVVATCQPLIGYVTQLGSNLRGLPAINEMMADVVQGLPSVTQLSSHLPALPTVPAVVAMVGRVQGQAADLCSAVTARTGGLLQGLQAQIGLHVPRQAAGVLLVTAAQSGDLLRGAVARIGGLLG